MRLGVFMKRVRWSWFLPIALLIVAVAGHIYGPHQYRVTARRRGVVNNPEYHFQHFPAMAERVSQGINFPALVLAYPWRNDYSIVYEHNSAYTLIWFEHRDISFYVGVVLFWLCVGTKLDGTRGRFRRAIWSRRATVVGLACGAAFGLLTGAYALQMTAMEWRPYREIGAFGIVWSLALISYFAWRMKRELGSGSG